MEDIKNQELNDEEIAQVTGGASANQTRGNSTVKYGNKAGSEAEKGAKGGASGIVLTIE